jgi:hypothetical protein
MVTDTIQNKNNATTNSNIRAMKSTKEITQLFKSNGLVKTTFRKSGKYFHAKNKGDFSITRGVRSFTIEAKQHSVDFIKSLLVINGYSFELNNEILITVKYN